MSRTLFFCFSEEGVVNRSKNGSGQVLKFVVLLYTYVLPGMRYARSAEVFKRMPAVGALPKTRESYLSFAVFFSITKNSSNIDYNRSIKFIVNCIFGEK